MADESTLAAPATPELNAVEQEISAIKAVMTALQPLDGPTRIRVMLYVADKFQIVLKQAGEPPSITSGGLLAAKNEPPVPVRVRDIRSFRQEKNPRSANEMAAIVAYYLAELAPPTERSATVTVDLAVRNFKLAQYPLPHRPEQLLVNAKNAGYLDAAGDTGAYRLNPIGHNLVAHTLPRSEAAGSTRKKRPAKSKSKKPAKRER